MSESIRQPAAGARPVAASTTESSTGRTLVVLPTYNEIENVQAAVTAVRRLGHDVLIVDDNSPDGTGVLADRLAGADPGIEVLHRPGKLGLGTAYIQGFQIGLARGYDLLVEMDADGSHDARHLDQLIQAAATSGGLAIGSRYVPGGEVVGWGWFRHLLSTSANLYARTVLGVEVRDSTSGYRCYTAAVLRAIDLDRIVSQGYAFQVEMVYRCRRLGFPVVEVPIRFEDRELGRSKMSRREVMMGFLWVLRLRLDTWSATRPRG